MEGEVQTFDVLVKGNKVGFAYDVNPLVIERDEECKSYLEALKKELDFSDEEKSLIDVCLAVVSAKDGDDVTFGPVEIVALGDLAGKYPSKMKEIMACSHHLTQSTECSGDLPSGFYAIAADAHGALAEIMSSALKIGSIINVPNDDVSDDDFEEDISDEDFEIIDEE